MFIRPLLAAFGFLTRFPLPLASSIAGGPTPRDLGRSISFFPLVGLVLGLPTLGLAYLAAELLPSLVIAVGLVALLAALTGGLHLDGVADLFDGLGGGRGNRERTLEIMRDSHIGAHGTAALVLVLLAKVAAVSALLEAREFPALLAFPLFARWAVTPQLVLFRYARPEGLGRAFRDQGGWPQVLVATALVLVFVVAVGGPNLALAKQAGMALATSLLLGLWLNARLGGLTGDVYGATIELCEAAALCTAAMR